MPLYWTTALTIIPLAAPEVNAQLLLREELGFTLGVTACCHEGTQRCLVRFERDGEKSGNITEGGS